MNFNKFLKISIIFLVISAWIFSGWPQIWQKPAIPPEIEQAQALNKVNNWNFASDASGWTYTGATATDVCGTTTSTTETVHESYGYDGTTGNPSGSYKFTLNTTSNNVNRKGRITQTITAPGTGNVKVKGRFDYYASGVSWNGTANTSWVRVDIYDSADSTYVANIGCASFNSNQAWTTTSWSSDITLTGGTTYTVRISARIRNTTTDGATSIWVDNIVVNSAPTGLSGSAVAGTTNVSLDWSDSSGGTGAPALYQYKIYRGGSYLNQSGTTSAYTDTTCGGNTTCSYTVSDVDVGKDGTGGNSDDMESPQTSSVNVLTCPDLPTSLNFTNVQSTSLRLNWTAPTGGADSYKVERCQGTGCTPSQIASGVTTTYYDDSNLTCNTLYRYRVRATNTCGVGDGAYSSIAEQTTGACGPSITGPSSVQMPNYTLGGAGYTERNFQDVSGLVQVTASAGFTVTVVSTNLTGTNNTILASNVKLKTDGTASTNPTQIINCSGFSGITETASGEYSLNSAQTIVTTSSGSGTCDIYPTIRVYISNTGTYVEQDSGTLTFTVTSP